MSAKKAAKKAAKKTAAKKTAGKAPAKSPHHPKKHHELKDLRRAWEHLGRIEVLQHVLHKQASAEIGALASLAQQQWNSGHFDDAAELLRAAEHLTFASAALNNASPLSRELEVSIASEFDHFARKTVERWAEKGDRHSVVAAAYTSALHHAHSAFEQKAWRQAMELIRAAEALAHVHRDGPDQLTTDARPRLSSAS